ncbi:hypothetical protein DFH05DRAFT_1600845, partial [Lentinula detonsa]
QLVFEANVVAYVTHLSSLVSTKKKGAPLGRLPDSVPIYGPRFSPPTLNNALKRDPSGASITPALLYIKPVNVVHPFYYPNEMNKCPRCHSVDFKWNGWTGDGSRDVHGVAFEETAIGTQLRCHTCKHNKDNDGNSMPHCFATTSNLFWDQVPHWELPR